MSSDVRHESEGIFAVEEILPEKTLLLNEGKGDNRVCVNECEHLCTEFDIVFASLLNNNVF